MKTTIDIVGWAGWILLFFMIPGFIRTAIRWEADQRGKFLTIINPVLLIIVWLLPFITELHRIHTIWIAVVAVIGSILVRDTLEPAYYALVRNLKSPQQDADVEKIQKARRKPKRG